MKIFESKIRFERKRPIRRSLVETQKVSNALERRVNTEQTEKLRWRLKTSVERVEFLRQSGRAFQTSAKGAVHYTDIPPPLLYGLCVYRVAHSIVNLLLTPRSHSQSVSLSLRLEWYNVS